MAEPAAPRPRRRALTALAIAAALVAALLGVRALLDGDGGVSSGRDKGGEAARYREGERPAAWPAGLPYPGGGRIWSAAERDGSLTATFASSGPSVANASGWAGELRKAGFRSGKPTRLQPGMWGLAAERDGTVVTAAFGPFPDPNDPNYDTIVSVTLAAGDGSGEDGSRAGGPFRRGP